MAAIRFEKWLDTLSDAWTNNKPFAIAEQCSDKIQYFESPFEKPLRSKVEIQKQWEVDLSDQKDVTFTYNLLSYFQDVGIAHWQTTFTRVSTGQNVTLDGIFQIRLDKRDLCSEFRQWWVTKD